MRDAGEVAFYVGHEHGHAQVGEAFGQALQGDGFARTGGPGDQAVAVGLVGPQMAANVSTGAGVAGNENAFVVKSGAWVRGGESKSTMPSLVVHTIRHLKPRLFAQCVVASPRDTRRYRCGLRLALDKNPSVLMCRPECTTTLA